MRDGIVMGTREGLSPKLRLNAIGTHVLNPSTLDYMLRVMRDETAEPSRLDAMRPLLMSTRVSQP